jgi:Fe-S cluster assembly iron-binding protein IscA
MTQRREVSMVQVTPSAAHHIERVRAERGHVERSPRLVQSEGMVRLTFTTSTGGDDQRVEANGIAIYLAPDVGQRLSGATIDARQVDGREELVIRRQAKRAPA